MTDGWAFLVARGQHQGYRARLVPDVLAARGLSGVVEDVAGEQGEPGGAAVVRPVATTQGMVTVVYRIHRITPDDVGQARPVRDEHGRPLDIVYGYVCLQKTVAAVDHAALDASLRPALATYRMFLDDEAGFEVRTSTAFPLRWPSPAPTPAIAPGVATTPRAHGDSTVRHLTTRVGAAAVLVLGVLVLGVFGLVRALDRSDGSPADLAGTWTGELAPVGSDGPARRSATVTVSCPPAGCEPGRVIGEVRDPACAYTLTMDRMSGGSLRATVIARSGGSGAGCLANGRVTLRRTGDTVRLEWYAGDADDPFMRASTLETDRPA